MEASPPQLVGSFPPPSAQLEALLAQDRKLPKVGRAHTLRAPPCVCCTSLWKLQYSSYFWPNLKVLQKLELQVNPRRRIPAARQILGLFENVHFDVETILTLCEVEVLLVKRVVSTEKTSYRTDGGFWEQRQFQYTVRRVGAGIGIGEWRVMRVAT